jgi:Arc/MetJ-type ribon-helix-helix transcriptional regulator
MEKEPQMADNTTPGTVQINISMEPDLAAWIDEAMVDEGFDNRSAFVRRLIRQERTRKAQLALPLPAPEGAAVSATEGK